MTRIRIAATTAPPTRDAHVRGLLTAGVRSALIALGDRRVSVGGPVRPLDPERTERYLAAIARCATTPADAQHRPGVVAIQTACTHLRSRELTQAYLALHAAQDILARTTLDTDIGTGRR